jgi:hypothetical protein
MKNRLRISSNKVYIITYIDPDSKEVYYKTLCIPVKKALNNDWYMSDIEILEGQEYIQKENNWHLSYYNENLIIEELPEDNIEEIKRKYPEYFI